ncbi:hypothetical protein F511_30124 [Dorcoceras hygrometricum]|uniref:Uncharacterized protein n=1 Tax=Dorcoceras hygrometricum TaxID=472368 RepID=A0A2Z7A8S3_9LAMI|nr:hypothetical protein F511_30124 [Dorcoceras hygrometricum]
MAASFFFNAMQVDFESVLAMEHTGIARMFNNLEETGLKGFLAASAKKKKEKVKKVAVQQLVEAGSQVSPKKSNSGTISDEDSCPLARMNKCGAKRKLVVHSSDSEATVSVPPVLITKKHRTKRNKKVKTTTDHQAESQPGLISEIPAGVDKESTAGGPEVTMEKILEVEKQTEDISNAAGANPAQSAHSKVLALEFSTQAEQEQAVVKQQSQQVEQVEYIVRNIENVEETEAEKEHLDSVDGQHALEQLAPEEEDQPQKIPTHSGSSFGSSGHFIVHNEDSEDCLSP